MAHFFKARRTNEICVWLETHKHGLINNVLIFLDDNDAMRFKLKFSDQIQEEMEGGPSMTEARRRLIEFAGLHSDRSR